MTMISRTYDLAKVLAMKERILDHVKVRDFIGQRVVGSRLDDFVRAVHFLLPKDLPFDVVYESLAHLAGQTLDEETIETNAWRLAGNIARLRLHYPVPPWNRQVVDEMVPVQILSARRWVSPRRKPGAAFDFQVMAGTACPEVLTKFWTKGFCQLLSQRLGFSKPWGKYKFDDCYQFVNMRMYVKIETRLCKATPDFEAVWEKDDKIYPGSCLVWNKRILRARRRETYRCPRGFSSDIACHVCIVGQDECRAAVHDATFVKRRCDQCDKDTWFDPEQSAEICLDCQYRNLWR